MLTFPVYLLLGLVQGILEWLPVSSEGQLVVISTLSGLNDVDLALRLAFWLHLGTMFAVLVYFRKNWYRIAKPEDKDDVFLRKFLVITTIGTGISGVPVRIIFLDVLDVDFLAKTILIIVGMALILTAFLIRKSSQTYGEKELLDLSNLDLLIIGIAQGFSIIPGISRSGITVSFLLFYRIRTNQAFIGSFYMAVPATLGAIMLDLMFSIINGESLFSGLNAFGLVSGILIAFIFGILTIDSLLRIVNRFDFSKVTLSLGIAIIVFTVIN